MKNPSCLNRSFNSKRLVGCFAFFAVFVGMVFSAIGQTIYEAENATLSGSLIATQYPGYSGSGYADYQNASGDSVQFSLVANSAGTCPVAFRYANGSTGDRPLQLSVNGSVVVGSLSFPPTGGWANWAFTATNNVTLNAGINTIQITSFGFNGANVDYMLVAAGGTQPSPPGCAIVWENTQQHIDGFGFSSAWCGILSSAKNAALYGTLGMSLLRIRIDETANWSQEIANAAAAHSYGAKVLGCAWRAPASMVYYVTNYTTNTVTTPATITTNIFTYMSNTNFGAYATYLNQAANAHNLDYVSVKNEPDLYDSSDLNLTADQIRIFCESNAPTIGRPIAMADAVGFTDSFTDPTLNDPVAVSNVSIVSGHFYGNGNYVHTNALAHGKPVWMTEHYLTGGTTNFAVCLNFAKEINDAMKNQFSAYVAWWAYDGDTNINLANNSGIIFKDGYTMGQFSKFIRPGYYRVGTTSVGSSAQITAYQDTVSSNYVIVAINLGSTVITQQFNLYGFPAASVTPWITSYTQSLAVQPPIPNVGSSFTYFIQPSNIVSFVGTLPVAAPTNLIAAAGINKVNLSWNAVASATSYNVQRATVSGGPYNSVTSIAATNYSDTGLPAQGTYYYVVSALKGGGQSLNSLEVSAATPLVYTNTAAADSYVESGGNAGVNYGTSTNLLVKDNITGTAIRNTYLTFDVHGLANVLSATLTLMPNRVDDSTVKMYYGLASTNWTEAGITWNNQPGGSGVMFATNTVAAGVADVVDVTGVVKGQTTNGGLLSIEITQPTNSQNGLIQFCSKEHPVNSWRPTLTYTLPANTPPMLSPVANQAIGAGMTLNITNSATDSDVPVQMLTFSLPMAPTNAILNTNSGALTWRPLVTQANTTNPFTVMVADNGTPSMSATQSFVVTVNPLQPAQFSTPLLIGGQMVLQVNGAGGPDYQVQASTNLVDWTSVFTTNSPSMPFFWTNSTTGSPMSLFRILAGPPF